MFWLISTISDLQAAQDRVKLQVVFMAAYFGLRSVRWESEKWEQ